MFHLTLTYSASRRESTSGCSDAAGAGSLVCSLYTAKQQLSWVDVRQARNRFMYCINATSGSALSPVAFLDIFYRLYTSIALSVVGPSKCRTRGCNYEVLIVGKFIDPHSALLENGILFAINPSVYSMTRKYRLQISELLSTSMYYNDAISGCLRKKSTNNK